VLLPGGSELNGADQLRWTHKMMREVAAEERAELGLGSFDPFDPYALCELHGISVYGFADLAQFDLSHGAIQHFTTVRSSAWSAALIPIGSARVIIENEKHAPVRRRSNIAHELGHHLLEHSFDQVLLGGDHQRQFNPTQEKQAAFLAGELLVPFAAVERMAFDGWNNESVALKYNVSKQFAQNQMKGQRVRAQRAAVKYRSRSTPR
jgi:hypothetical protein